MPYSIYRIIKIKQLQEKGFSKINIQKIEEKGEKDENGRFEYKKYVKIKKYSIIISRFLISVQTIIPSVVRSSKSTICSFYSFDGDEGISYMTCILNEMNLIFFKDKTKSNEIIKNSLIETYNDFKTLSHIKELFNKKKIYDIEESKKKEEYIFNNENDNNHSNYILVEPSKLNDDYNKIIKTSNNTNKVKELQFQLLNRLHYLAKNIKKVTKEFIEKSALSNSYSGVLEVSCCTEEANKYLNYYYYIETESDYPIKKDIDESKQIFDYTKYFINIGSIHKFVLYDKNKFDGIKNGIIVDDEKHVSQNLMKSIFENYVNVGIYSGTLREYYGTKDNLIDIKSGMTKKDILSTVYTIEEYQKLLKEIEKHHIKYSEHTNKKIIFNDIELDNLKKTSNNLEKEINSLLNNIQIILNKDKNFKDIYLNLLRNLGVVNNDTNINKLNNKDRIKHKELINKNKLDYIKKVYITKLKKYLSMIKNENNNIEENITLKFEESDIIAKEIQREIYGDKQKILPFLNKNVREYFLNLSLNYTNEQINSINGMDNIYDSKYDKIKVYSNFNFDDASNVLLYIFILELNQLIILNEQGQLININSKNTKLRYICEFIMVILDEIKNDFEIFNECDISLGKDYFNFCKKNNCVERMKNNMIHELIEFKSKQYLKEDDYMERMMKSKLSKTKVSIDELSEKIEEEEIDVNEIEYEEKLDFILNKGKKELSKKLGYEPSEAELESYKEEYLKDIEGNEDDEIYDLNSGAKGQEVIDQGADYGGFNEYDFETGDGFDYSEEVYED
jgi:hypothetical protein